MSSRDRTRRTRRHRDRRSPPCCTPPATQVIAVRAHAARRRSRCRPDDGDPIVVPGPVLHRPRRDHRTRRRGAARRQGHPERAGRRLAGPAVRRAHGGVCAAERRRAGRAGRPVLPRVDRRARGGVVLRRDTARGLGAAAHAESGWSLPDTAPPTRLADAVRAARGCRSTSTPTSSARPGTSCWSTPSSG